MIFKIFAFCQICSDIVYVLYIRAIFQLIRKTDKGFDKGGLILWISPSCIPNVTPLYPL